jgi:uncharacterized membrane protein
MHEPPPHEARRIMFIDLLRLLAAVQMIQGHTLDALLDVELRHGPLFGAWTFTRGLTSTMFLVTAGLACVLAQQASRGAADAGRARRVRRAGKLLLIGYALHAPLGVLFGDAPQAAWRDALAVDVLQCIGVSVALLELLDWLVPGRRLRAALAGALGALCFALAGAAHSIDASGLLGGPWLPLIDYVTPRAGSLFPLLPFGGFVLWGMAVGLHVLPAQAPLRPGRAAAQLAAWGASSLLVAALLARAFPATRAQVGPAACALRLGLVLLLAAALVLALEGRVRLSPLLRRLASETLFLYVSHVLVLYAGHVGLAALVGRRLSVGAALASAGALLALCSGGALAYRRAVQALRRRGARGTPSRPSPQTPPAPG